MEVGMDGAGVAGFAGVGGRAASGLTGVLGSLITAWEETAADDAGVACAKIIRAAGRFSISAKVSETLSKRAVRNEIIIRSGK
jgi:hypothetical protein